MSVSEANDRGGASRTNVRASCAPSARFADSSPASGGALMFRTRPTGKARPAPILRDLPLPAIAVREQTLFVIVKFFACFGGELEVRAFHNRIDRARFLAVAAVNALHHVDVV